MSALKSLKRPYIRGLRSLVTSLAQMTARVGIVAAYVELDGLWRGQLISSVVANALDPFGASSMTYPITTGPNRNSLDPDLSTMGMSSIPHMSLPGDKVSSTARSADVTLKIE